MGKETVQYFFFLRKKGDADAASFFSLEDAASFLRKRELIKVPVLCVVNNSTVAPRPEMTTWVDHGCTHQHLSGQR
jgi:hypothetical protein